MTAMDDYYRRCQIPAFGSWECYDDGLPFTQCFETAARPAGFLRYSYSDDRDLYVAGDLYANDVVTPAMIVVPRRKKGKVGVNTDYDESKESGDWVVKKLKESPNSDFVRKPTPKPVDEDLYKISPELLYAKTKKKKRRGFSFFTCCVLPKCAVVP